MLSLIISITSAQLVSQVPSMWSLSPWFSGCLRGTMWCSPWRKPWRDPPSARPSCRILGALNSTLPFQSINPIRSYWIPLNPHVWFLPNPSIYKYVNKIWRSHFLDIFCFKLLAFSIGSMAGRWTPCRGRSTSTWILIALKRGRTCFAGWPCPSPRTRQGGGCQWQMLDGWGVDLWKKRGFQIFKKVSNNTCSFVFWFDFVGFLDISYFISSWIDVLRHYLMDLMWGEDINSRRTWAMRILLQLASNDHGSLGLFWPLKKGLLFASLVIV